MKKYIRYSEGLDTEDIRNFISSINQIITKLVNMDETKLDKFQDLLMNTIEDKLDKYLVKAIDRIIGDRKKISGSGFGPVEKALKDGLNYEGTEERTALSAAIDYLNIVLRKM